MSKANSETIMPKLRFPEYNDSRDWEEKQLWELSDRITEKVGDKKFTTVSITAGFGFVSQAEKFSRDISGKQYKNYIKLKAGEFAYNKGNSKTFPQGCIYKLTEFKEAAVPNSFLSFRFKENHVGDFYRGYFDNNYHGRQLLKYITSGARSDGLLNISPNDFFSIILPTPSDKDEQQKIADCLLSLDELIRHVGLKLEALKAHKKGLMQQLFPQEGETIPSLRFPEFKDAGNWIVKEVGILTNVVAGATPKSTVDEYWNGDIPWMSSGELNNKRIYSVQKKITKLGYKTTSTKLVPPGSVLIGLAGQGKTRGTAAITYIELCTNQSIASLVPNPDKFVSKFLYHKIDSLYHYLRSLSKGDGGRGGLNLKIIKSIKLQIPSIPEQQKIADCLSSLDNLIAIQRKKQEALEAHKKGLMQQLFPNPDGEEDE